MESLSGMAIRNNSKLRDLQIVKNVKFVNKSEEKACKLGILRILKLFVCFGYADLEYS